MNLQDLLLGIDGGGNVSVRGTMMEDDHEDSVSEEEDEEDEEEDDEDEYAGRGQVLKYKESQKPMENIKLAFVVQDLPPPSPKNKKTPSSSCDSQGVEKKYPCRYCGEKFGTNYMLGNHVSRKHRHLSKIFKPQKPVKVPGQGQTLRKRGRPRKYPLSPSSVSPSSSSSSISSSPSSSSGLPPINSINNNTFNNNNASAMTNNYPPMRQSEGSGRMEGEMNRNLTRLMEILHELEVSPTEKRAHVFERAPLFTNKLVALRALKQACDLELISTPQYLGKQEEFLLSFSF